MSRKVAKLAEPLIQRSAIHPASTGHKSKKSSGDVQPTASQQFPTCIQRTKVQICGDLYREYRERGYKMYKDAPADGLIADAEYFDNRPLVGNAKSTVLLVHGSPGNYNFYSSLIGHLTGVGVRVVSPNMPSLGYTKDNKHFRHSPEERVEFIKAILEHADLDNVDLLCTHSSGTFAGVRLWAQSALTKADNKSPLQMPECSFVNPIGVRAFAFFNPLGADITVPMQPYWWSRFFIKTWQNPTGRELLEKVGVPLLVKLGNPFAGNKLEDIVQGGCCLHYNNRAEFKAITEKMAAKKVPQLIVMSDNDSVMTKKMNANLLHSCGTSAEDATIYDRNGKLERVGVYNDRIKVIRTRSGGHFSFLKYPPLVNPAISDLLARVSAKQRKAESPSLFESQPLEKRPEVGDEINIGGSRMRQMREKLLVA